MYRTVRRLLAFVPLMLGAVLCVAQPQETVRSQVEGTVLRGGWRYDVTAGEMKRNTGIVVLNGKFFDVGADLSRSDLSHAQVITLNDDEYVLPGLIDMHGHYDVMLLSDRRVDSVDVNPVVYLANGVTSTFTAGEFDPDAVRKARLRIDAGQQIGPRIFQAGPKFGVASPQWHEDATAADVQALVDHWANLGVKRFKAYGLKPEQLQVLIQRAHQYGLTVTAHLLGRDYINPKTAILMGIDGIEHYPGGDTFPPNRFAYDYLDKIDTTSANFKELMGLFLEHKVYYDPTLTRFSFLGRGPKDTGEILPYWADEKAIFTPWIQQRTRKQTLEGRPDPWPRIPEVLRGVVKAFYDMGGRDLITMGTDNPSTGYYLPGFDAHRELQNFVLAGIPPADALRFATLNGAKSLNVSERLGSIDTGKWADLFVVRGNPLQDIRNTRSIRLVMKAGQIYDPHMLLQSVKGKLGPVDKADEKNW